MILIVGGWLDIHWDQECRSLQNIVKYDVKNKLWTEHELNFEIFEPGLCLSFDEKFMLLCGGYKNGDGSNGDEYLNEIYRIDISNDRFEIEKLPITCPEFGTCTVTIFTNTKTNDEKNLLCLGFKKRTVELANCELFSNMPSYLTKLMANYLCIEMIYYINHKSGKCYSILYNY